MEDLFQQHLDALGRLSDPVELQKLAIGDVQKKEGYLKSLARALEDVGEDLPGEMSNQAAKLAEFVAKRMEMIRAELSSR